MPLKETIEKLMQINGELTISDLSRLTSIPQPTLSHILSGETKRPRLKLLEILANFFSVPISQLTGIPPALTEQIKQPTEIKINSVPIINWGELNNLSVLNLLEHAGKKIVTEVCLSKKSFALVSTGNKLEQLFPEGCILVFDPIRPPKNRDFVIVYIEENQDFLLRRIFIEGNVQYVRSPESIVNDASLHKLDSNVDKIIGTLVESKIRF